MPTLYFECVVFMKLWETYCRVIDDIVLPVGAQLAVGVTYPVVIFKNFNIFPPRYVSMVVKIPLNSFMSHRWKCVQL